MKMTFACLILAGTISIILFSCHKEPAATPSSTAGGYSSVADFINKNGAPMQNFSLNATAGGSLTGTKGTVFNFSPGAFMNSQNVVVTGSVNISLKEIYANADMLFSNKPTTANNGTLPLLSGGEFYISATQNGQALHISPGNYYSATMPSANVIQGMKLYVANTADTNNVVNWVAANDSAGNIGVDSSSGYSFYGDSLTWINCDQVYPNNGTYYTITANPVNCPNPAQTLVYVLVNNKLAVWQLSSNGAGQFVTPTDIVPNVPLTIVGLCTNAGQVYSAFTPVTVTSNQTVTLNFAVTTDTIFKTQVRAIN